MTMTLINSHIKKGLKDRVLRIHRKAYYKLVVRKSRKNKEEHEIHKETYTIKKRTKNTLEKVASSGAV